MSWTKSISYLQGTLSTCPFRFFRNWAQNVPNTRLDYKISKNFNGVPLNFTSVFRYTNGLLYFLDDEYYYEYDEFTNRVVRSFKRDVSIFDIDCANKTLLEQLQTIIKTLLLQ